MTKTSIVSQSHLLRSLERYPALPALLARLPPRTAAALFQRIGISDAAELMTLVPVDSLLRTLDESIWKKMLPGQAETIDTSELIEWFETWNEIGEEFMLERLEAMSDDYLVLLLSYLVCVESETLCGAADDEYFVEADIDDRARFGAFLVRPIDGGHQDTLNNMLNALWLDSPERVILVLDRLATTPDTEDRHRGWTTTLLDVEFDRRSFREAHGYVSHSDAHAFLVYADSLLPQEILDISEYDAHTRRHFDVLARKRSVANPIFRAEEKHVDGLQEDTGNELVLQSSADNEMSVLLSALRTVELLESNEAPLLLTTSTIAEEPSLMINLCRLAAEDSESFEHRTLELAYLANVLLAAGSADGELSDKDAKDAAFSTCCLGYELSLDDSAGDLQKDPALIRAFLLGRHAVNLIPQQVVRAFEAAIATTDIEQSWLRGEASLAVRDLRTSIAGRNFVDAREAVILLSIVFDTTTCHAIAPLLDAMPRYSLLLEGGKRASDVRWINAKRDLDRIDSLLAAIRLRNAKGDALI
ncbi:MAG TPA: DUF6178 family protein [Steroidobacteraceae bacterium]|nr:DUF6178 family protein [Steroidobacteraceae bacterium]